MKPDTYAGYTGAHLELIAVSESASRAIPPLWPLASSVAVNPFLGQSGQSLAEVSALLGRVAGTSATMPRDWYCDQIESGAITDGDLTEALAAAPSGAPSSVADLRAAAGEASAQIKALPTVADLAAQVSGIDWPRLIDDRIGAWAAGYFDKGQALWQLTQGRDVFESWQIFAARDVTPEIAGLSGFAATVSNTPERARTALAFNSEALGLTPEAAATYYHQLLLGLGGWAQLARHSLWQAELAGKSDTSTTDMLTIRIVWELALFQQYRADIEDQWAEVCAAHAKAPVPDGAQIVDAILQDAADRSAQRNLARTLATKPAETSKDRPSLQAAFCIDVRSEVFRRALESVRPDIQTLGFAGFFGLTVAHRGFASDTEELRLPVLLSPGLSSTSSAVATADADLSARLRSRTARAWGRFKLAAVSSFAFVEATGPIYAGKLLRDALGLHGAPGKDTHKPQFETELSLDDRVAAGAKILRAMSLTADFAPLVLIVGHGANVVNNPHASALHCGACGGYSGEINARLLAILLNAPDVRAGLAKDGIDIPKDTVFIGALHDTTTDAITLYEGDLDTAMDTQKLLSAKDTLAAAGKLARTERALRLPRSGSGDAVVPRSKDWSETRPEWALAGCNAFIAAPRHKTRGKALAGQAFLHDYDWRKDDGFGVLELILTAPVVVVSWISLQYYGSVVAPKLFGSGNKVLHNVTGGVGVVEGNGGILRGGLPWQSVHDGEKLAHNPLRLSVCIEAPAEAVSEILARHDGVRALFDNRWLHLFLLDEGGQIAMRYVGDLNWQEAAFHSA